MASFTGRRILVRIVADVLAAGVTTFAPPPLNVSIEKFAAATVPFVGDRARIALANEYAPAADFKAFALNNAGVNAFVVAQPNEEAAKSAAVEQCQKHANAVQSPRKCEVYAVGNTVVSMYGHPPLPPTPWIVHDPSTERPLVASPSEPLSDQRATLRAAVEISGASTETRSSLIAYRAPR